MSQKKLIAALSVVILGLGGLLYWDDWDAERTKLADEEATKLLLGSPEDIVSIEYDSQVDPEENTKPGAEPEKGSDGPVHMKLTKSKDQWTIGEPISYAADTKQVNHFLKALFDYNYAKSISKDKSRYSDFGVLEGERRIKLGRADGTSVTIYVGKAAPIGYNAYVRTTDAEDVYIGSQHIRVASSKKMFDFRDKAIATIDRAKVNRWSYFRKQDQGDIKLDFERQDDNPFLIVGQSNKPVSIKTSDANVRDFLDDINEMKAAGFVDDPSSELRAKFGSPDLAVSWSIDTDGTPAKSALLFVKHGGAFHVTRDQESQVFKLNEGMNARLEKDLMFFRNRRVFDFDSAQLNQIKIDGDEFSLINGKWYPSDVSKSFDSDGKFTGEGEPPAESVHVRAFVTDMEFAETFAYIQLNDPVVASLPSAPEHRVVFRMKDDREITADLFPVKDEKEYRFLKHDEGEFLYKIDSKLLQSLTPSSHAEGEGELGVDEEDLETGIDDMAEGPFGESDKG
jgi:hypothetical protein